MIRFFDLFFSILALVVFFPLILPIVIILLFTGEGEIFYKQKRVGLHGKSFNLLKFATMLKNSPRIGAGEITLKNDPRVLPFGRFLRKTKINELPQIFNIIFGHISIVGPRPMVPDTFRKYSSEAKLELKKIKPGLTGIGSIFFRDEEKFLDGKKEPRKFYDEHIIPFKNELEIWFVRNRSISVYFKIIFITAWVIIFSKSNVLKKHFRDLPLVPDPLKIL